MLPAEKKRNEKNIENTLLEVSNEASDISRDREREGGGEGKMETACTLMQN